jgi:uncharacterized coiled-coil DUF342 family protein
MTDLNHLIEQHIREHDARRQHIDELAEKAHERVAESDEHKEAREQLAALMAERDKLIVRVDEFKLKSLEQWRENEHRCLVQMKCPSNAAQFISFFPGQDRETILI